jgi:hypothetical protein
MKTLIIYDNTGYIYLQLKSTENRIPQGGIQFLETEIPEGKTLKSIDTSVTPNTPIYEDIPIPEIQVVQQQLQEAQNLIIEYVNSKYNALLNY